MVLFQLQVLAMQPAEISDIEGKKNQVVRAGIFELYDVRLSQQTRLEGRRDIETTSPQSSDEGSCHGIFVEIPSDARHSCAPFLELTVLGRETIRFLQFRGKRGFDGFSIGVIRGQGGIDLSQLEVGILIHNFFRGEAALV